jgi:hypothetical protein
MDPAVKSHPVTGQLLPGTLLPCTLWLGTLSR